MVLLNNDRIAVARQAFLVGVSPGSDVIRHRPIAQLQDQRPRGANGQFQSRQQQNEQVIETAMDKERRAATEDVGDRPQAGQARLTN
jgi:hypothetical protein